ncbi:MAG: SGNH/GDSL hydrolase family protein [Pirellulales bacterium]
MIRSMVAAFLFCCAATASADPITIVTFGDSTTAPRTLPDGSSLVTYSDLLQAELPALIGQDVEIVNAGVGGNMTTHAVARLASDVLSHNPDYVVVQFGINDAFVVNGATPQVPLANYVANMQTIIDGIRGGGAEPVLMAPFPLSYLVWFSGWTYAPYHDRVNENALNRDYAAELVLLARDNSVLLLDPASAYYDWLATGPANLELYHLDYVHPNANAHRLEADLLLAGFAGVVLPVPEPSGLLLGTIASVALIAFSRRTSRSKAGIRIRAC